MIRSRRVRAAFVQLDDHLVTRFAQRLQDRGRPIEHDARVGTQKVSRLFLFAVMGQNRFHRSRYSGHEDSEGARKS